MMTLLCIKKNEEVWCNFFFLAFEFSLLCSFITSCIFNAEKFAFVMINSSYFLSSSVICHLFYKEIFLRIACAYGSHSTGSYFTRCMAVNIKITKLSKQELDKKRIGATFT